MVKQLLACARQQKKKNKNPTMKDHFLPTRVAITRKTITSVGESGTHCWECKTVQLLYKAVWQFLKKLQRKPPVDPEIPILNIYPKN